MRTGAVVALVTTFLLSSGARALFLTHDPELQILELTKRLEREPRRCELHVRRGREYEALERWSDAIADYQKALQVDPNFDAALMALARTHLVIQRPDLALLDAEAVLSRRPYSGDVWLIYARALDRAGYGPESALAYAQAVQLLERPRPEHVLEQADVLDRLGPTRWRDALDCLDAGAARFGGAISLELAALDFERRLGMYDRALMRNDRLMRRARRKETWLMRRAEILGQAGQSEQARQSLLEAMACIEALPTHLQELPSVRSLKRIAEKALEQHDSTSEISSR